MDRFGLVPQFKTHINDLPHILVVYYYVRSVVEHDKHSRFTFWLIRADQLAPSTLHMDHGGTLPQTCSV